MKPETAPRQYGATPDTSRLRRALWRAVRRPVTNPDSIRLPVLADEDLEAALRIVSRMARELEAGGHLKLAARARMAARGIGWILLEHEHAA